ncbi:MAG: tRNA pseudouridine(38-40) synthase TruA [Halobacteriovoraceae bacterium]|nr:tRNA pseudouridine(38-40) synthase TruA [Halobacteriovoraceae bacterium]
MKFFKKLCISYNGQNYFGWQNQPDCPTIQGELDRVLCCIFKTDTVKSIGSGRTDAKVHALGQIVRIQVPFFIEDIALLKALNSLLPDDIQVLSVCDSNEEFHPIFQAKKKLYRYMLYSGSVDPFYNHYLTHINYKLDFELLKLACECFKGEHDFRNFQCTGTPVKSTLRTIYSVKVGEIEYCHPIDLDKKLSVISLEFEGNGFLKQMVRAISGAIISVGRGKLELEELMHYINVEKIGHCAPIAQPQGLYLVNVSY